MILRVRKNRHFVEINSQGPDRFRWVPSRWYCQPRFDSTAVKKRKLSAVISNAMDERKYKTEISFYKSSRFWNRMNEQISSLILRIRLISFKLFFLAKESLDKTLVDYNQICIDICTIHKPLHRFFSHLQYSLFFLRFKSFNADTINR